MKQTTGDTVGEYVYDALGRRVKKVVSDVSDTLDGTTLFYYDGLRVIEKGELDGSNDYVATHQFVWGLYLDELMVYDYDDDADGNFDAIDQENGDKRYYCLQDFIYSTAAVIDSSGTVQERCDYKPYGEVSFWSADYTDTNDETQVHNDVLFTGQMHDPETGLHHYKARALHPTLGRFPQRDPLRLATAGDAPQYRYVASAPHHMLDPEGECEYCGPTVDEYFARELSSVMIWIKRNKLNVRRRYRRWYALNLIGFNITTAKTEIDRLRILYGLGMSLDFGIGAVAASPADNIVCPSAGNCEKTYWLCGRCVHNHMIGNIMFGFILKGCGFTNWGTKLVGDRVNRSHHDVPDPAWDKAGYDIGRRIPFGRHDASTLCAAITADPALFAKANTTAKGAHAWGYKHCRECPLGRPLALSGRPRANAWPILSP